MLLPYHSFEEKQQIWLRMSQQGSSKRRRAPAMNLTKLSDPSWMPLPAPLHQETFLLLRSHAETSALGTRYSPAEQEPGCSLCSLTGIIALIGSLFPLEVSACTSITGSFSGLGGRSWLKAGGIWAALSELNPKGHFTPIIIQTKRNDDLRQQREDEALADKEGYDRGGWSQSET